MSDEEFKALAEITGLDGTQLEALKGGFEGFDKENTGCINSTQSQMIFKMMGVQVQKNAIEETISELESDSEKVDFETFCKIAAKHMLEEDEEGLRDELKEAFRIYDKEGNGYITTDVLKEILREIDQELTEDDLENIIEEVDEDGSGTLDFDEFQEMMMG